MNTLKRLSWQNNEAHLVPPGARSPGRTATSPQQGGYPFPSQAQVAGPSVDRQTLHKTLASLSELLGALDEYRSLSAAAAKAHEQVAKKQRNLAVCFDGKVEQGARDNTIVSALLACSSMFESIAEVDAQHAKRLKKEYESINELAGKYFNKTSKEEKSFDETISQLDYKVQKVTATYEKSRSRAPKSMSEANSSAAAHDTYIQSLSSLSASISSFKAEYAESSAVKRQRAVKEAAKILCSIAEATWRNRVEGTRKGGLMAAAVVERGVFCESGMPQVPEPEAGLPRDRTAETREDKKERAATSGLRGPRPQPPSEHDTGYEPGQPTLNASLGLPFVPQSPGGSSSRGGAEASRPFVHSSTSYATLDDRLEAPQASRPVSVARFGSSNSVSSALSRSQQLQNESDRGEPLFNIPTSHQMAPSNSAATMHSLSSTSSNDTRQIIPPRGFILDDEPLSATSESETETRQQQQVDSRGVQRPTPRYGPSPPHDPPQLGRTDTSASERNFVARMREKYALEKERRQEEEDRARAQDRAPSPSIARSASRVSHLAKRYSSPPEPSAETFSSFPSSTRPTPSHRHSNSMQPLGSYTHDTVSTQYDEFGRSQNSWEAPHHAPSSSFGSPTSKSRPLPRPQTEPQMQTSAPAPPGAEAHSSVCACESCTRTNYGTRSRGGAMGVQETSKEEELRLQKEFRELGGKGQGGRRISLPAAFSKQ